MTTKLRLLIPFFCLATLPVYSQAQIQDADGDTRVQTEATPDDDRIRFRVSGAEVLVVRRTPAGFVLFENLANGANTFFGEKAGEAGTSGGANVFIGFSAGKANTEAGFNTFVGAQAGQTNTTGANNTFIGGNAGFTNTSGAGNVFLGERAGQKNTTGSSNVFLGQAAGQENTTTSGNVFIGTNAGTLNATGSSHVFIGFNAGAATVNNSSNTYVGSEAGLSSTSGGNTYIGALAGRNNATGGGNTFLGMMAGQNTSTGSDNTIIGNQAGTAIIAGNLNVVLGKNAGTNFNSSACTFLGASAKASAAGLSNATALGNSAVVNANNKVRLGNTAVLVVEGNAAYTVSDGRFKRDVRTDAPGLDFVMRLQPVTYHFAYPEFSRFLGEENVDQTVLAGRAQLREMGFVAQEVERLCTAQGVAVSNLVHVPESAADNYSLAYGQLVVPLVQAIQEQQGQIEALRAELAELKKLLPLSGTAANAAAPAGRTATVFPNPATDRLNLRLNGFFHENETVQLVLTEAAGRAVLRQTVPAAGATALLLPAGLPAGHYALTVQAENGGLLFSGLFVKQ